MQSSHHYAKPSAATGDKKPWPHHRQQASKQKTSRGLPRKCAIIRRSFVNGVEKTELRFVAYNRINSEEDDTYNERGFLADVDSFLQEQIRGANSSDAESVSGATASYQPTSVSGSELDTSTAEGGAVTVISASTSSALSSTHHEPSCHKSEFLRQALPSLERLVQYYKDKYQQTSNLQYKMLRMTAEDVLADTQKALIAGGVPMDSLLQRIKLLNSVEHEATKR